MPWACSGTMTDDAAKQAAVVMETQGGPRVFFFLKEDGRLQKSRKGRGGAQLPGAGSAAAVAGSGDGGGGGGALQSKAQCASDAGRSG